MSSSIPEQRIKRLFRLADRRITEDFEDSQKLADRYVQLARNIGMKYSIPISSDLKKEYCHECLSFLKPGVNCKVRINSKNSTVNYNCKVCGKVNRYGF